MALKGDCLSTGKMGICSNGGGGGGCRVTGGNGKGVNPLDLADPYLWGCAQLAKKGETVRKQTQNCHTKGGKGGMSTGT